MVYNPDEIEKDDKEIFLEELSKKSKKQVKRLKEQLLKLTPSSIDILKEEANIQEIEVI